jgi:hypothetical protein
MGTAGNAQSPDPSLGSMSACDVCGNPTYDAELKTIADGSVKVCPACLREAQMILILGLEKPTPNCEVVGQALAEPDEIEKTKVGDIVSGECTLYEAELIARVIRVRRFVETLVVLVTAPEAAGRKRPTKTA